MPEDAFAVLGVRVHAAPFHEAVTRALHAPETGERLAMHFATAHSIVSAHDVEDVRRALDGGLVEPDGMPLVWLGRRRGLRVERVCGPDFMPALVEAGIPLGRTHFFYGGAPGVAEQLVARLKRLHPGVRVAGIISPPYRELTPAEDDDVVEAINVARPDYVWVGLGAPKQDLWVASHRSRLDASVLLAVGAAFDFHAGRRSRAPRWMQRAGLEWVHRLASEPRRLAGRYTRINARFARLLIKEWRTNRRASR
jgi:N-acetylglucosaminyldiphosphoundecaprenol N-acetyl-beta-D-mannosaminyltransferase